MPLGPKPFVSYWRSRKAYDCWIGPQQHILAKEPDDAPTGPTYLTVLHTACTETLDIVEGRKPGTMDDIAKLMKESLEHGSRATARSR